MAGRHTLVCCSYSHSSNPNFRYLIDSGKAGLARFHSCFFPGRHFDRSFRWIFRGDRVDGVCLSKDGKEEFPLVSAIYLGLLWTVWHAVADYLGASQAFDELWLLHFLVWMVATFTAMRVLIVWVYTNTRSLLLAQLMHACSSGLLYILVPSLSPTNDILFYGVYAVVLWLLVAILFILYSNRLISIRKTIAQH
jgi:hypothetical protein